MTGLLDNNLLAHAESFLAQPIGSNPDITIGISVMILVIGLVVYTWWFG
jgi:uncharacterized membrane protein (DUF485 family)